MKQLKLSFLLAIITITSIIAQPAPPAGKQWNKVENLSDDFNGNFNTAKWQKPLWNYGVPVNMIAANSGVSGGNLWIKATEGSGNRWFNTSRVMSNARIKFPMYTECSIKSAHISAYTTYWLNNGDINNRDEIDICENNSKPSITSQSNNRPFVMYSQYFIALNGNTERAHANFDNRNLPNGNPAKGKKWNEQYQTLGCWWIDARTVQYYINGQKAGINRTISRSFTRSQNIIWDLWTGDFSWLGGLAVRSDLNNNNINTMYVNWINTYQLVDAPGGGGGGNNNVAVTGVNLTPANLSVAAGSTGNLTGAVVPNNATVKTMTFTSNNTSVATVNQSGVVTGVSAGTAVITARTTDGNKIDTSTVTVTGAGGGGGGGNSTDPTFYVSNRQNSKKIATIGNSNNTNIQLVAANTTNNASRWKSVTTNGGYFYLRNQAASNRHIRPVNNSNGSAIQQVANTLTGNFTQWRKVNSSNGFFYLQNRSTGKYFRPQNGNNGSIIQQQPTSFAGNWTQWKFLDVNTGAAVKTESDKETEISNAETSSLMITNNPVKAGELMHVELGNATGNSHLSVFDIQGKLVNSMTVDSNSVDIDTQGMHGIYLIRAERSNGPSVVKVLVK